MLKSVKGLYKANGAVKFISFDDLGVCESNQNGGETDKEMIRPE